MKNVLGSFITLLFGIGIIIASFCYMIPKLKNKSTKFVNFIDAINNWLKINWIWAIVIVLVIALTCLIIFIAKIQQK